MNERSVFLDCGHLFPEPGCRRCTLKTMITNSVFGKMKDMSDVADKVTCMVCGRSHFEGLGRRPVCAVWKLALELSKEAKMSKTRDDVSEETGRALDELLVELDRAVDCFDPFASAHEGYAILKEEVDELWELVKRKGDLPNGTSRHEAMRREACQVAAMAVRFMLDVTPRPDDVFRYATTDSMTDAEEIDACERGDEFTDTEEGGL